MVGGSDRIQGGRPSSTYKDAWFGDLSSQSGAKQGPPHLRLEPEIPFTASPHPWHTPGLFLE